MKALVTGSGGREHSLAWKLAQSPQVEQVWVAPGNAGTQQEPGVQNVPLDAMDFKGLAAFARKEAIDLTLVGPEAPLVAGMVDYFQQAGLRCFGPSKAAAQLEGSKSFTKDFLQRHRIPTAAYQVFDDLQPALAHLRECSYPLVIKADGLAAGKGVVIAQAAEEAAQTLTEMMSGAALAGAGKRVVLEEFLAGEEASFIVIADGSACLAFASSQDHKAAYDGDRGPNTGGMGAYSPAPVVTPAVHQRIMQEVIEPTLAGMKAEAMPYTGFLYAGLMIDRAGAPKVIEFNCRFGDPEAQPVLTRLSSDLAALCQAALDGKLADASIAFAPDPALTVVLASGGYPGPYQQGHPITGLDKLADMPSVKAFHAGTAFKDQRLVTAGGRVLGITATAKTLAAAQSQAYQAAAAIHFPAIHYRKDIAHRALAKG